MSTFFAAGGAGMYPVLLFGFLTLASAVMYLLRPERRFVGLMVALGLTTAFAAMLGFATGMVGVFRYASTQPQADQFTVVTAGLSEALNVPVLALVLLVITGLLASIGAFRASRNAAMKANA